MAAKSAQPRPVWRHGRARSTSCSSRAASSAHDLERHRRPTLRDFLPEPFDLPRYGHRRRPPRRCRHWNGQAIAVYGDYDVDGATSAALLIRFLRGLGVVRAALRIPDRLLEGYGPVRRSVSSGWRREGAQLIVTVDCGAMAYEALGCRPGRGRRCHRGRSPQVRPRAAARCRARQSQPAR